MNRNYAKLLALLLALLALTACGKKQDMTTEATVSQESQPHLETRETLPEGLAYRDEVDALLAAIEETASETTTSAETMANNFGKSDTLKQDTSKSDSSKAENTVPTESKAEVNTPTEVPMQTSCGCEYERFSAMSPEEQEAYAENFASVKEFVEWCNAAQAEHNAHSNIITVEGGTLELSDYID